MLRGTLEQGKYVFGTACGAAAKVFEIFNNEPQINLYKNYVR
jgi:hypothetical protein